MLCVIRDFVQFRGVSTVLTRINKKTLVQSINDYKSMVCKENFGGYSLAIVKVEFTSTRQQQNELFFYLQKKKHRTPYCPICKLNIIVNPHLFISPEKKKYLISFFYGCFFPHLTSSAKTSTSIQTNLFL